MEMKIGKEQPLVEFANSYMDHHITWEMVTWLKSITNLPVVIKGILTGITAVTRVYYAMLKDTDEPPSPYSTAPINNDGNVI